MIRRNILGCYILFMAGLFSACGPKSVWRDQVPSAAPASAPAEEPKASSEAYETSETPESPPPILLDKGERKSAIPPYRVPETLREKLLKELPDFIPAQSKAFELVNPHLKIRVKDATMVFTGLLRVDGRPDESVELSCRFDPAKSWVCPNMYPTREDIARERRLQASVNCVDTYQCDDVGIELFVAVDGRIESQFFQTKPFAMRRASSGDAPDEEAPKVYEKPTAPPVEERELSEEDLKTIADDSNMALEFVAPVVVPDPSAGDYSIPDIEKHRPARASRASSQAIGAHNRGRLEKAAALPRRGEGYVVRSGSDRNFGTNSLIGLIQAAAGEMARVDQKAPPIVVADISKSLGGRLKNRSGRYHGSHQTGLDADISFPSRNSARGDLWPVCSGASRSRCAKGGKIAHDFDEERFWTFLTSLTCVEDQPVIAIFVDTEIKKHMCRWVKSNGKGDLSDPNSCAYRTLRALKYEPGHHNHIHIRLKCPGNPECRNATVSLGKGTGC